MTTAEANGRTYEVEAIETGLPTQRHLSAKGFEPTIYLGVAAPTGRQRVTFTSMFYRVAKTGQFVNAI